MKKESCINCLGKYGTQFYLVFRVLVGLMFFMHGAGKLFGWFGGTAMGFGGLMGIAGIVEVVVGLAILLGFWTRLAALLGGVTMLVAYVYMHWGLNPLTSGGELALMYLLAFLVLMKDGAGKLWSLEQQVTGKERF